MAILGDSTVHRLCDVDSVSCRDVRLSADLAGLTGCEVLERDGLTAVSEWIALPDRTVVHIDPFNPWARTEGGPTAVELAADVAQSGRTLVYWYGYSAPDRRAWAADTIRRLTDVPLWWGDFMTTDEHGDPGGDGDLGRATTPGTGSGVVLANVSRDLVDACTSLGMEVARAYAGVLLPSGVPGRADFVVAGAHGVV